MQVKFFYEKYQRFFVLFGGLLLNFSIGSFYTYNTMSPYIVQYMQTCSNSSIVDTKNIMLIFIFVIFGMGSSVTLGDYISKKIGPSWTVLIAGWVMSLNILLMRVTLNTYLWVVVVTYGLFNGICSGIVYGVTMGTVCSWFPNRRGTVLGVLVGGFGLSAFIFHFIQLEFMVRNPRISWMDHILDSYLLLGGILMILQLIGASIIKNKPIDEENIETALFREYNILSVMMRNIKVNLKPHNLFFEVDFWILWITYSLLSACIILNVIFDKQFGFKYTDNSSKALQITLMLVPLSNAIGSFLWGLVIDRVQYKKAMAILTITLAITSGTFYLTLSPSSINPTQNFSVITRTKNISIFYIIWIFLLALIPSGVFSIFPHTCANLFGQKNFIANYGILYTAWSVGAVIAMVISYSIWYPKLTHPKNSFLWIFLSVSFMSILAFLMTLTYSGRIRYQLNWLDQP